MPSLPPAPVPFPTTGQPGIRTLESNGRLVNSYIEPLGDGAPSKLIYRRAPGLRFFGRSGRVGFRGGVEFDGTAYAAFAGRLLTFDAGGGQLTDVGGFSGNAKGFFARNNKAPAQDQIFCDIQGNLQQFTTTTVTTLPRPAAMSPPNSLCVIDGFFVFTTSTGTIWCSELNSTTIGDANFAKAEAKSDGLTRAIPWAGNLFLFGPATTEVWTNVGATPFPFQRSIVIPRGIAGPYCVAGFEDNFSRALVWVADDNTVVRLNGYTPEKISPPDLDGLIENVTDKRQLEMSVYMSRGHAFIILSANKTVSGTWPEWSWVFDLNNNTWAERKSYLRDRSRITGGFLAFQKWLCGDTLSGDICEITDQVNTEMGQPFRWRVESGAVEKFPVGERVGRFDCEFVTGVGIAESPPRLVHNVVDTLPADQFIPGYDLTIALQIEDLPPLDLEQNDAVEVKGVQGTFEANGTWQIILSNDAAGHNIVVLKGSTLLNPYTSGGTVVGLTSRSPNETDPVVEISWSDDGGVTYYSPIVRKLGRQQDTRELVSLISCTGRSGWTGRRWRLDISDPVYVGFMGAFQNVSPLVSDMR